jgi:hypothetical protein
VHSDTRIDLEVIIRNLHGAIGAMKTFKSHLGMEASKHHLLAWFRLCFPRRVVCDLKNEPVVVYPMDKSPEDIWSLFETEMSGSVVCSVATRLAGIRAICCDPHPFVEVPQNLLPMISVHTV